MSYLDLTGEIWGAYREYFEKNNRVLRDICHTDRTVLTINWKRSGLRHTRCPCVICDQTLIDPIVLKGLEFLLKEIYYNVRTQ